MSARPWHRPRSPSPEFCQMTALLASSTRALIDELWASLACLPWSLPVGQASQLVSCSLNVRRVLNIRRSELVMSGSSPLRGREGEFALIGELLTMATRGEGSFLVVEGRAGFGKTRLLQSAVESEMELPFAAGELRQRGDCLITRVAHHVDDDIRVLDDLAFIASSLTWAPPGRSEVGAGISVALREARRARRNSWPVPWPAVRAELVLAQIRPSDSSRVARIRVRFRKWTWGQFSPIMSAGTWSASWRRLAPKASCWITLIMRTVYRGEYCAHELCASNGEIGDFGSITGRSSSAA